MGGVVLVLDPDFAADLLAQSRPAILGRRRHGGGNHVLSLLKAC